MASEEGQRVCCPRKQVKTAFQGRESVADRSSTVTELNVRVRIWRSSRIFNSFGGGAGAKTEFMWIQQKRNGRGVEKGNRHNSLQFHYKRKQSMGPIQCSGRNHP